MLNFTRFFTVFAVLVLAGCAAQQDAAQTASSGSVQSSRATEESTSDGDPDEMICRREQVTGTNFRRRVCMTRAERQREQDDSQEEMLERRSAVR